jgi:hypothetical protein
MQSTRTASVSVDCSSALGHKLKVYNEGCDTPSENEILGVNHHCISDSALEQLLVLQCPNNTTLRCSKHLWQSVQVFTGPAKRVNRVSQIWMQGVTYVRTGPSKWCIAHASITSPIVVDEPLLDAIDVAASLSASVSFGHALKMCIIPKGEIAIPYFLQARMVS